jgi:3-oxoacyl-[acyl-carrier-protein] synthase III
MESYNQESYSMSKLKVSVEGIGAYLPGEPVSIAEIDAYIGAIPGVELSRYYDIIERYAGVKYRHYALEKGTGRLLEESSGLAYKAASKALERAGVDARDLDLIVSATSTPPYLRAGLAKEVRVLLGNAGCATYDLWAACTGVQQAITLASSGIRSGMFRKALIVGVELASTSERAENYAADKIERTDMLLRAAIGDGAGALVLTGTDDPAAEDGVLYTRSGTEGQTPSAFHRQAGGSTMPLTPESFRQGLHHWHHDFAGMVKQGRPYLLKIIQRALEAASVSIDDLDAIVPAAANFNYFKREEEVLKSLSAEEAAFALKVRDKTFTNFASVGNVPSAAIYIALNELYEKGRLRQGSLLLLPSIEGATWGWGASLLRWRGSARSSR